MYFPETEIEKDLFNWAEKKMEDYWDDSLAHESVSAMCADVGFSDEICEWLAGCFDAQSASEAGIPRDVILGKKKLKPELDVDVATIEVEGVDSKDYPDFVDAYVSHACKKDGTELTEAELERFTEENPGLVHEKATESFT